MSSIPPEVRIVQYGLSEIYSASAPHVDIVFIHGLNGHPHHTWATRKPDTFWPTDLLPKALEDQQCRILTYGYDANVGTFTDGASKDEIHNHAEHLASRLVANRSLKKATERPIIFVCHSLGGLVVKRCLIYCKNVRHAHTERLRSIYVSTYGILFLGTPHNGSDIAKWGTLLQSICSAMLPKKFFDSSPQLVEALKTNNVQLQNINRLFIEIIGRFHIYFFHESKPMDFKGTRHLVVDEESAAPVIEGVERMGIERDHSQMCKFEDENAPGYDVVAEAIQRYSTDAPNLIASRWNEERKIREFERQGAARELLGDSIFQMSGAHTPDPEQSAKPSQPVSLDSSFQSIKSKENDPGVPLLIAPLGFRPNSLFLGFQKELYQIKQKLDNTKRKKLGSCSVLIWGPTGCGKSYLARQYLWVHREDYPGGSFWVDAKSEQSRCRGFWDIGQAAALLGVSEPRNQDWDASSKFIDAVRKWFELRDGWLLVFDGVSFDSDDDIHDFMKFIPDHSGGSIIFTSLDRTLANRQRLLDPPPVKVHPLSIEDARTLLYRSLGIREPTSVQVAKATELVKHCDCLPLAVHATAHALIAKGRTIEKYSPGSTEKRLAIPYLEIVEALQEKGHIEAVNLITILSLLNHNIPVELLHLGRKILLDYGIEVRAPDRDGRSKRDLDNTIAVLIRYGLVERTMQPYQLNTTLSAESSLATPSTTNGNASPDVPRQSIEMDDSAPSAISASDAGTIVEKLGTSAIMMIEQRPDSSLAGTSQNSVTYSIDILRVHTVVQSVFRDEIKLKDDGKQAYWWWLGVAARLLCHSYITANDHIKASARQGLVRDYREYETQAARIWTHFPKNPRKANLSLKKARHDLHNVIRAIKKEIESRSPTQSFDSIRHRVQVSIFDRASSTSSDGQGTPSSNLTRASTWSLGDEAVRARSESPTQLYSDQTFEGFQSDDSWEDPGYEPSDDDSPHSSSPTTRRSSKSDTTETAEAQLQPRDLNAARRPSFLQTLFKGRPILTKKQQKDLGEWKPLPAPPSLTLSHTDSRPISSTGSSKASSSDDIRAARPMTAGSDAEAALAAVHRSSPPSSRGGHIRSPSRPRGSQDSSTTNEELLRKPLAMRSPNLSLSPLAAEFNPSEFVRPPTSPTKSQQSSRNHSRHPTAAPGFENQNIVPASISVTPGCRDLPLPFELQVEESITITRRVPVGALPAINAYTSSLPTRSQAYEAMQPPRLIAQQMGLPTGYTSAPMSRDVSKESNDSVEDLEWHSQ